MSRIAPYIRSAKRAFDFVSNAGGPQWLSAAANSFKRARTGINSAAKPAAAGSRKRKRVGAYAKLARAFRKRGRGSGKMLRARRGGRNKRRRELLKLLTAPQFYNSKVADQIDLLPSDTTVGFRRTVFAFAHATVGGLPNSNPSGAQDPFQLRQMAAKVSADTYPAIKFTVAKYRVRHLLHNQGTTTIHIKAHLCEARHDLPNLAPYNTLAIQDIIGQGFAENQYDKSKPNSTNVALQDPSISLFQSKKFTEAFKVVKTQSVSILPSKQAVFTDTYGTFNVSPNRWMQFSATKDTYATGDLLLHWLQGERFWLFEARMSDIINLSATPATITQPSGKINMVTELAWTFQFTEDEQSKIYNSAVPSNVGSGATLASQRMIALGGGIVQQAPAIA